MKKLLSMLSAIAAPMLLCASSALPASQALKRPAPAGQGVSINQLSLNASTPQRRVNSGHGGHMRDRAPKGLDMAATSARVPAPRKMQAAPLFAPGGLQLNGVLTYLDSWGGWNTEEGIYSFSSTSGVMQKLYECEILTTTGFEAGGIIYAPFVEDWGFMKISTFNAVDPSTKSYQTLTSEFTTDYTMYTATYLPSLEKGLSYGRTASGENCLMTVSLMGVVQKVADLGAIDFSGGISCGEDGRIYALTLGGDLYTVNPADFSVSKVGSTGVTSYYASCIYYDSKNDVIYAPTSPETATSEFYSINPTTAEATKLYEFAENLELRLLYTPAAAAADDAPGAPTAPAVSFPDGSLSGTFTFLPPTLTYGGEQGQGELDYTLEVDGLPYSSGKTSFGGEAVVCPVSFTQGGNHLFRVYCSNSAGQGEAASITAFIGPDAPLPVDGVKLSYDNGTMSLSWDEVKGENGGFIDQSRVTYTIRRVVGSEMEEVANSLTGTTWSEPYPQPDGGTEIVYYQVRAIFAGVPSTFTSSNKVMLGYTFPPYEDYFGTEADFLNYLPIDANADGKTWVYDKDKKAAYCAYSSENQADDYLVIPAMQLKKGKIYFISFVAGSVNDFYHETLSMVVGKAATPQALNTVLIEPTTFNTEFKLNEDGTHSGTEFNTQFIPQEDGIYYFAIKGQSQPDLYRMFVSDLKISGANDSAAPGLCTSLLLTANDEGEPEVTIEFDAPTEDVSGGSLSEISYIDVFREDEMVKRVKNVTPGEHVTVVDGAAPDGNVTYHITAANAAGEGLTLSGSVYVGFDVPQAPSALTLTSGADYGEVNISWPEVKYDINGLQLSSVTYTLLRRGEGLDEWLVLDENLTTTTFTDRVCPSDATQDFAQYAILAVNEIGESAATPSDLICVGKPYSMPYTESFSFDPVTQQLGSILGIARTAGQGGWSACSDGTFQEISSQDGDDAFICFRGYDAGDAAILYTGRIHIDADAANPEFSFYYYCANPADRNIIEVLADTGSGFTPLATSFTAGTGTAGEWNRASFSLEQLKGKDVQLAIRCTLVSMLSTAFDNMQVKNQAAHDLAAEIRTPQTATVGQNLQVTVFVHNYGTASESGWSVDLEQDWKVVETRAGEPIAPGAVQSFVFELPIGAAAPEQITLKARVNCSTDTELSNNDTDPVKVSVVRPTLPAVDDLTAMLDANDQVILAWSQPEYKAEPQPFTEGFESADSFATMSQGYTAGWTFLDLDGAGVGGIQDLDIPNVPFNSPASFFILDQSTAGFNATFVGHNESSKTLAALYNVSGRQNDDWAISPELYGSAQTVTFYARAYDAGSPETIEVLYSTTDKDPANFSSVKSFTLRADAARSWSECSFDLPEGAKYFAIRYRSTDAFLVLIDDVTFIPAGAEPLSLIGYNIYRDGVKINTEPVKATTFTDPEKVASSRYVVTALYNCGESAASDPVYPRGNAVDELGAGVRVIGLQGAILVEGAETVSVTDMQGRVIYRGGSARIPASAGTYLVQTPGGVTKILVK